MVIFPVTFKPHQSCAPVPPNPDHVPPAPDVQLQSMVMGSVEESLAPNQTDMVQSIPPSMTSPGHPNPTIVPRPEMGRMEESSSLPPRDLNLNFPPPDNPDLPQFEAEMGSSR